MADQLSGNPWVLDGTTKNAVLVSTWIQVEHFEFADYTAGASVTLADRNGRIVWNATATSDLQEVRSAKVGWINGLQNLSSAQNSGTILVYLY